MNQATELLRRKELFQRLSIYHLSEWECRQIVAAGVIKGRAFRPGGSKHYNWAEVKAALHLEEENV